MGTKRGLEKQTLRNKSITLFFSEFKGVRGLGLLRLITFPFRLFVEFLKAFLYFAYEPILDSSNIGFDNLKL